MPSTLNLKLEGFKVFSHLSGPHPQSLVLEMKLDKGLHLEFKQFPFCWGLDEVRGPRNIASGQIG